jgi:WD40 repeat protein
MAWSPMPTHRNLVATGLSSGRTVLLNISPATLALPANNTTPSSSQFTVAQLSVKHIRAVTAVAFSPVDSNYLATGYDRHRSDYSLLIWDVSDAISRLQPENNSSWRRPLDRLDVNNPQAKDPRWLPTEPRPIQQYCPNETINSLCFLHSDIHSLLVGANGKSIRLYDLRAPNPPPAGTSPRDNSVIPGVSAQWATRAVNGLAADPNRGERFASFELNSGECVVKVFDVRKPGVETLSFKVTGTVVALEWLQDGRLAAGTKEHGVTLWNFVDGSHETKDGKEDFTVVGGMRMCEYSCWVMAECSVDTQERLTYFCISLYTKWTEGYSRSKERRIPIYRSYR